MDASEKAILSSPLGKLSTQDSFGAGWRAEGLLVLEWALGLASLVPHDVKADPFLLTDNLYFLHADARLIQHEAKLRSLDELNTCREFYYAIHVRLRSFLRAAARKDVTHYFEENWHTVLGVPPPLLGGDLAVQGRPIADADRKSITTSEAIVNERHRAAIWLIGEGGRSYTSFSVDT